MKYILTGGVLFLFTMLALVFLVALFAGWKKSSVFRKIFCALGFLLSSITGLVCIVVLLYLLGSDNDFKKVCTDTGSFAVDETGDLAVGENADLPKLAGTRFKEAAEMSEKALETNDRELYMKAVSYAESAASLAPSEPKYSILAGKLYSQITGEYDAQLAAEPYFRKALESDPENLQASLLLADCCYRQERFAAAAEILEKIISSNPELVDKPEIIKMISMCYLLDLQTEKGCAFLQKVLSAFPKNETARISLAALKYRKGENRSAVGDLQKVVVAGGINKEYATSLLLAINGDGNR